MNGGVKARSLDVEMGAVLEGNVYQMETTTALVPEDAPEATTKGLKEGGSANSTPSAEDERSAPDREETNSNGRAEDAGDELDHLFGGD